MRSIRPGSSRARLFALLPAFLILLFVLVDTNTASAQAGPSTRSASSVTPAPASAPFSTAGIGTGARPIDGLWQFHLGDDPDGKLGWAQPDFDDSQWERIPADSPWGDHGHLGYSGFAWYRRQIALNPADPTTPAKLALLLPELDSVAEVYWNGVKVGGLGTLPPHAFWYYAPRPVAIALPTSAGAGGKNSGTLAIRLWMRPLLSYDVTDAGGFQSALTLGYAPLIQQRAEGWVEHRFRLHGVRNATSLIYLLVTLGSLLLWVRQRSQWLFLWVTFYFGTIFVVGYLQSVLGDSWVLVSSAEQLGASVADPALWILLLLLLGLNRHRFWLWFTLAMAALDLLSGMMGVGEVLTILTHPRLSHFLDVANELASYPSPFVTLLLVAVGVFTRKPRLPSLLFAAAAALEMFLEDVTSLLSQSFTRMDALLTFLHQPLFEIYGSSITVFAASELLLLLAMLYAVWDHASQQMVRRRLIDAEFKSAQEVQQILVPEAQAEDAPGYAIASVYRPASEVGGDFFQIIPLPDQSTLIVAGDVSGKGLRAAMTVSLVVGAIRTLAEQDPSPAAVLAGLNRRLIGRTQGGFATCCALRVNPSGEAIVANAGHCQPYIDGKEIELPNGIPLGIVDGITYEETTLTLLQGAQMVLVSDGVPEARNEKGELFGFERTAAISTQSAESIAHAAQIFGQDDDITVLTLTRHAVAHAY